MDPRIVIFLAVARLGQLTRASQRLNMAPSSVSSQIAALEHDMGSTLFIRGSRGMKLTPSGKALFIAAEQIEALWNKATRDVLAEHEGSARITIASSQTAAELFLPRPLGRFRARWPDTRIHLVMTNSQTVIDQVRDGTADIGIIEGASSRSRLHHERLWSDELAVIVSTQHPLARHPRLTIPELLTCDWILRERGSGTRRVFEHALEKAGFSVYDLNVMMELTSLRAIVAMVANNVGVSVVSRAILDADDLSISGIVPLAVEGLDLWRTLEATTSPTRQSPHARYLLESLRHDVLIRRKQREPITEPE